MDTRATLAVAMARRRASLRARRRVLVVLLVVLVAVCLGGVHAVAFPGGISQCPNDADRQFVVAVPTREPLGLRLSDKLEILEFVADAQGRSRVVEASGLAEIGDRLVAVNHVTLTGLAFQDALAEIAAAALPKLLRFQTYDGRCTVVAPTPNASSTDAASAAVATDVVVLSMGKKTSEQSFYAVRSADGRPPGCLFRGVVVAQPGDACAPLRVNATDKYIVVPDILGCPTHQKAAYAQEAGAAGVVFVQRMGAKPQQIKLPSDLPAPISLPLVMVSFDSGWQLVESVAGARPFEAPRLRFAFSGECSSDKFALHPDDDPFQQSVVNRIDATNAGFLSLTVAQSGATTLSAAAFEFLRPQVMAADANAPGLPLGRLPLFLRATASTLNACELRADRQPPQLTFWASEIDGAFVAIEWRDAECSVVAQVEFFASKNAVGVVFADAAFPTAAHAESTRIAAQQVTIPFVFVSTTAMDTMREYAQHEQANHVLVEFAGENALQHQWTDLALLGDEANWPTTERARERLYHRMLKDQEALNMESGDHVSLAKDERRDALDVSFEKVQRLYQRKSRPHL